MNAETKKMYADEKNFLPIGGGWVSISGNTWSMTCGRGMRIPEAIREEGVRHLDIYWAYDEEVPWKSPRGRATRFASQVFSSEEYWDLLCGSNGIEEFIQLSYMKLHTPSSKAIHMWRGELKTFSSELIQELLATDNLEIIPIGALQSSPVWDEETRDLVGSLMLDGLSYHEAQAELVTAGVDFAVHQKLPSWFYRPIGWYYDTFCEEPEYHAAKG